MTLTSSLTAALDVRRAADWVGFMSTLRLAGAALVAMGVLCELVGEIAGRASEQTLEIAREAEFTRLAGQVATLSRSDPSDERALTRTDADAATPLSPNGLHICPRTGRLVGRGHARPL